MIQQHIRSVYPERLSKTSHSFTFTGSFPKLLKALHWEDLRIQNHPMSLLTWCILGMCLYIQIYLHIYKRILCESKCAHIHTYVYIYILFIYLFVHLLIPFPTIVTTSLSHGPIDPMLNRWRDGSSIHSATGRPFFILRTGDHHAKKKNLQQN